MLIATEWDLLSVYHSPEKVLMENICSLEGDGNVAV
jgi:hypothetical protein